MVILGDPFSVIDFLFPLDKKLGFMSQNTLKNEFAGLAVRAGIFLLRPFHTKCQMRLRTFEKFDGDLSLADIANMDMGRSVVIRIEKAVETFN